MNYTEDQKLMAYAPYIGCDSTLNGKTTRPLTKHHLPIAISLGFKPILKPLSAITDEHACEVAMLAANEEAKGWAEVTWKTDKQVILDMTPSKRQVVIDIAECDIHISELYSNQSPYNYPQIIDLLRYLGYDISSYHLGGKTLIEAGLAIDSTVTEKEGTK